MVYKVFDTNLPISHAHITLNIFQSRRMSESFEKSNVVIMFPNSSTSVLLGKQITSDMANLSFYIPGDCHEQAAHTCLEEVKIESAGLGVQVEKMSSLDKMDTFDYVLFPSLYVNPRKSYADFAAMCRNKGGGGGIFQHF